MAISYNTPVICLTKKSDAVLLGYYFMLNGTTASGMMINNYKGNNGVG